MTMDALRQAVATIAEIERNGLLPDLKLDIAAERKGWPRSDLRRFPHAAGYAKFIADEAAQLLGLPYSVCEAAAAQELLPNTRQKQVIQALNRYKARIRGRE